MEKMINMSEQTFCIVKITEFCGSGKKNVVLCLEVSNSEFFGRKF